MVVDHRPRREDVGSFASQEKKRALGNRRIFRRRNARSRPTLRRHRARARVVVDVDLALPFIGQTWSTLAMKTNTSQFKAKLGAYMRAVREGKEVIITDRDRPVARLIPFEPARGLQMIHPLAGTPPFGKIKLKGIPYCGTDST